MPSYATEYSAGVDLYAAIKQPITLSPGQRACINTGIAIEVPSGYEAQIRPRSGLSLKFGITILNTPGTIDADYRGEIMVILINLSDTEYTINHMDRIAQMVISPVMHVTWEQVDNFDSNTNRGSNGFGSTGI
ncbi:dUTP diphosphatase family protein [Candidatus Neoehrlichia lotoris str. RAC413]|uniref:Deoxyuridine 5'-triphosphate nucleotidohydrolase n=1 Tax=Candidatus Neoehrlichia procyonis str. RAC413 TaxID=1359163 RepID=A0A0F3NLQ1_9RICK|nr:dUTP diphosphatase family protein [Candidatus Neoehrlichia lotoris str. RAC413]